MTTIQYNQNIASSDREHEIKSTNGSSYGSATQQCEDSFDDISFYIGDEHDGFCTSASLGDSDISVSDSEYDCDDDDDWSFDCECVDDSEGTSASVNIGEEACYGAFSPRESLPSPAQNVSTSTLWRGQRIQEANTLAAPNPDPFQLIRPKTTTPTDVMPGMAPLSHGSLTSLDSMESVSMSNEEWSNPSPVKVPSTLLQRASLSGKASSQEPISQASIDEKSINELCAAAAKVGGAALLLSIWGSTFVAHTNTETGKTDSTFQSRSQSPVRC